MVFTSMVLALIEALICTGGFAQQLISAATFYFEPSHKHQVINTIIPILQVRKLRHREIY